MDKFVVICDDIRSLYNVGSIFRTSDAVGVDKIYLCGISGRPDSVLTKEKIAKVSLGAEKIIPWEYKKQSWRLIEKLRNDGYQIIALEIAKSSINYRKFKPKFPLVLVLGNEVSGVRKSILEKSDDIIEIPMRGQKESLNVSVAFGIVSSWIGGFK